MGSSFFSKAGDYLAAPIKAAGSIISDPDPKNLLDPVGLGAILAKSPLAESPTFTRLVAQAPGYRAFSQLSPGAAQMGGTYLNRNQPGDLPAGSIPGQSVNQPGAWAGVNPSMSAAQTGYTPQSYAQQMKAASLQAQATPTNTQNQSRQNAAASIWG
jgi:hypothetical protein